MRQTPQYAGAMQAIAQQQNNLGRIVDAYSATLQAVIAAAPQDEIDQILDAEQAAMAVNSDPREHFVPITKTFLDQMSRGAFVSPDALLMGIESVKSHK